MNKFIIAELIGKSSRLLNNNLSQKLSLAKLKLTTEQWIILQIISGGSKTQKELGTITLKNKASINSLISNLLKLEYVAKVISKTDRRKTIISITTVGNNIRKQAEKIASISINEALEGFSFNEIEQAIIFLAKINDNLLKEN